MFLLETDFLFLKNKSLLVTCVPVFCLLLSYQLKDHKFEFCLDCQSSSNFEYMCWAHSFTRAGQKLMFGKLFRLAIVKNVPATSCYVYDILKVQCRNTKLNRLTFRLDTIVEE